MTNFLNAKELSLKFPETFHRPSKKELNNIKNGDLVKVCYENERFWVIVKLICDQDIIGSIDNELITKKLKYADLIKFTKNNIYAIYK